MNLIDILDVYSLVHDSDDMLLLLSDYKVDDRVNRDVLNGTILSELGASRPITTDPDLFKILLDNFFKKYSGNITRLMDTVVLEYNPLDTKNIQRTVGEGEHRHSIGDIDNTDNYTTNAGVEDKVSAYDSNTYQPKDKSDSITSHDGTTTSDIESTVDTNKDISETIAGKDGDTSFQNLIEQERKVAEFNIYNWIIRQMRRELFLLIY